MTPLILSLFALLAADPKISCDMHQGATRSGETAWIFLCSGKGEQPKAPDSIPDELKPLLGPTAQAAPKSDAPEAAPVAPKHPAKSAEHDDPCTPRGEI